MNRKRTKVLRSAAALARTGSALISFAATILGIAIILVTLAAFFQADQISTRGSSQYLQAYKPEESRNPEQKPLSLQELHHLNPDVLGWIEIQNTKIDQPFVQGDDDLEYLNKDARGEFSLAGAIFLASDNQPDFSDCCSLMYGHHMDDGGMFGDLDLFVDQKYLETHHKGVLQTLDGKWNIDLFAILETDSADRMIYFPMRYTSASDLQPLMEYLQTKSTAWRDPDEHPQHLILLSTCQNADSSARLIAVGTLEQAESFKDGN